MGAIRVYGGYKDVWGGYKDVWGGLLRMYGGASKDVWGAIRLYGGGPGRMGSLLGVLTGVIDPGLDDVVEGESARGLLIPEAFVELRGEDFGHVVVVLREVREFLLG